MQREHLFWQEKRPGATDYVGVVARSINELKLEGADEKDIKVSEPERYKPEWSADDSPCWRVVVSAP